MRKLLLPLSLLACGLALAACGPFDANDSGDNTVGVPQALTANQPSEPQAAGGPLGRPATWVDCEQFAGVVTPANFDPESDPFDELYTGTSGFKNGAPLISDSKPGDADYNGGRWHLNLLKDGVPADKYSDACRVEDLDTDDFDSTTTYFECPLLPRRGRSPDMN